MTAVDPAQPSISSPFLSHLIALLSIYELGPNSAPPPRYDGPSDWQTDTIERSLAAVAKRMYAAEEHLGRVLALQKDKQSVSSQCVLSAVFFLQLSSLHPTHSSHGQCRKRPIQSPMNLAL